MIARRRFLKSAFAAVGGLALPASGSGVGRTVAAKPSAKGVYRGAKLIHEDLETPVADDCDVIVAGGGPAGIAAAVTAGVVSAAAGNEPDAKHLQTHGTVYLGQLPKPGFTILVK